MKGTLTILAAALLSCAAAAEPVFVDGPRTFRLLDSECSSEIAIAALKRHNARTPAKRADVTVYGQFIPACWAEDQDGDIMIIDRDGTSGVNVYRESFGLTRPDT